MTEVLYAQNRVLIVVGLFAAMHLALESGYRVGARRSDTATASGRGQISAIEGAMLGLLAVFLGFTFSLARQRSDRRGDAVVQQVNAIGTAWLRVDLLPPGADKRSRLLMRDDIDNRVAESQMALADAATRGCWLARSANISAALWREVAANARTEGRLHASGLIVRALNDLIDAFSTTASVIDKHVPEVVLLRLLLTFATAIATVGVASGITRHLPPPAVVAIIGLIVLMTILIIDRARPRRGLLRIDRPALLELQATAAAAAAPVHGQLGS